MNSHRFERGAFRASLGRAFKRRTDLLNDDTGSTTEAVVATALALLILSVIAGGTVSSVSALTVASTNAERTQQLNVMTSKPAAVPGWTDLREGEAALREQVALPSGVDMPAYLWAVPAEKGTEYFAAMPRSGNLDDQGKCADTVTVQADFCVYASAFHANDLRATEPERIGALVSDFSAPVPARATLATVPAQSGEVSARYFVNAAAVGAEGEIHILQGNKILAIIPISTDSADNDYFGSFTIAPGAEVTVRSPDRDMKVTELLIYKAGV